MDASAYMLGMDMGVVDRQASGLQHVDALHLSMHGSCNGVCAFGEGSWVKSQEPSGFGRERSKGSAGVGQILLRKLP